MPINDDLTPRQYSLDLLNPWVKDRFELLARALAETTPFLVFETWRSPDRQQILLERGTSKAKPWHSAHQWGMAVDFVPFIDGQWVWDLEAADWRVISHNCMKFNLDAPISWDPGHVQAPEFRKLPVYL